MNETPDPYSLPTHYTPSPALFPAPGTAPPLAPTAPAPAEPQRAGRALRPVYLLPALASAVPLAAGRLWYAHGGHSLAAFGVGGLATVGFAMAFATRSDSYTAAVTAALSAFVLDFAISAYSPEIYLPFGLFALTATAAYTAAMRAWRRDGRRANKAAANREQHQLTAATTVHVAQIKAQRDIAIAAIQAQAAVKVAETHATALTISAVPYPLLELDPTARAMLTLDPKVKAMLERRPVYELDPAPADRHTDTTDPPQ